MKQLNLKILEDGISTGLSQRHGGFLAEAASVCLDSHKHPIKTKFSVEGTIVENYELQRLDVSELVVNSFKDMQEATEFGAMGLAIAIIQENSGLKVKRSWKGTGFDWWVGEQGTGLPFQNKKRLEVSGKLDGSDSQIKARLNEKLEQTKVSDQEKLPAVAIVVEFSTPKSLTGQR